MMVMLMRFCWFDDYDGDGDGCVGLMMGMERGTRRSCFMNLSALLKRYDGKRR